MSLELCILASGSAGNAAILTIAGGGSADRCRHRSANAALRLDGTGVRPSDISALCLTHLNSDHFAPRWTSTLRLLNIPIYCHAKKSMNASNLILASDVDEHARADLSK